MNETRFWELIDNSRAAAGGDSRKQSGLLAQELAWWPIADMFDFEDIFRSLTNKSYVAELWDAAWVIEGSLCSDDCFSSYQQWLVGQGKEIFDRAPADPESLADVIEVGSRNVYPTLLGVVDKTYELATGQEAPPRFWNRAPLKGEHIGGQATLNRFPKLRTKYWDWWMEQYGIESADG